MNSKIDYLISTIKRSIPPEILDYAFRAPMSFNQLQSSIDYELRNRIIDGWVLKDCNVVGGIEVFVDILGCNIKDYPGGTLIMVPDSQTNGRVITSVLSMTFSMGTYYTGSMGNDIVNGVVGITATGTAKIQLVGHNAVYLEGGLISPMRYLKCIVENDKELMNINDRSLVLLSKMVVLATKAYIYTNFSIKAENMPIIQGLPMGKLSDILGEYADSLEMYNDLLNTKFRRMLALNDRRQHNNMIRMMLQK